MTSKDYRSFAAVMKNTLDLTEGQYGRTVAEAIVMDTVCSIAAGLVQVFKADNDRFNAAIFTAACGLTVRDLQDYRARIRSGFVTGSEGVIAMDRFSVSVDEFAKMAEKGFDK